MTRCKRHGIAWLGNDNQCMACRAIDAETLAAVLQSQLTALRAMLLTLADMWADADAPPEFRVYACGSFGEAMSDVIDYALKIQNEQDNFQGE